MANKLCKSEFWLLVITIPEVNSGGEMVWITKNFDVLVDVLKPFLAVHAIDFQRDLNFLIHKNINLQQNLKIC